jgi:hypothetical protein
LGVSGSLFCLIFLQFYVETIIGGEWNMESSNLHITPSHLRKRAFLFILSACFVQVGYSILPVESKADGASIELGLPSFNPADADGEEFPESSFGKPPTPGGQALKAYSFVPTKKNLGRKLASAGDTVRDTMDPLKKALIRGQATQEVALIADDLGFLPRKISVTQGVPVRLFVTSASKKVLCLMIDQFEVRKQIRSQRVEEVSFVPEGRDPIRFYCPINGKEGFLYVKDPNPNMVQGS